MRFFKSEFVHSYESYSFGYCDHAEREEGDALSELYEKGLLPYTGAPGIARTLYMARSARVRLADFEPTSENRRVLKKFDGRLVRTVTPLDAFPRDDAFSNFCLHYFAERHGAATMPRTRLSTILDAGFITDVASYRENDTVAYALLAQDARCSHFWFSFYDLAYVRQSLGLWLLLDCARAAKAEGKEYFYLGTVYGEKGLYKTNFPALEFWDGSRWDADTSRLRSLCKTDDSRTIRNADEWKRGLPHF